MTVNPCKVRSLLLICALLLVPGFLCSCSENDGEEDEYANWEPRNKAYFASEYAKDRDSIAYSRSVYGESWEKYCNRRIYLSYSRQYDGTHSYTDSVAVEILRRGSGKISPYSGDSVRIVYRTLLIPTSLHPDGIIVDHTGSSTSYAKVFDYRSRAPKTFKVSALVRGVATALLYMHTGDRWRLTIPSALAYGESGTTSVPAGSTVIFEMELVGIYRQGTVPGTWQ